MALERAEHGVLGQSVPRVDGVAKATGHAKYADDIRLPGMLVGKILRSPHPHARIHGIDTRAAEALPGVYAVVTAADFPLVRSGRRFRDRTLIAREKVRYVGEPVAAVAAEDEAAARQAMDLIAVDYEVLPAVFDAETAAQPDAPLVHEEVESYAGYVDGPPRQGMSKNVATWTHIERGDVDRAFAAADVVVEETYRTQRQACAPMETHSALASVDPITGVATVWSTTASPFRIRAQTAEFLGVSVSKIKIVPTAVGGSFGGKLEADPEPFAVALARKAGRPVKITYTRGEEFVGATQRLPAIIQMRTAAKRDGTLVAREARLLYNTGARANVGSLVLAYATMLACGPYKIPNVRLTGYAIYTNTVPGGAFRGFGDPQICFAYDSQLDRLAQQLGMDPVELRLRNLVEEGEEMPSGQIMRSVTARECLLAAAERIGYRPGSPRTPYRGVGFACADALYGGFPSGATVRLNEDGTAVVQLGTTDVGQGMETVMAQIVAAELGIKLADVSVTVPDTDSAPFDMGSFGSRVTFHTGNAVRGAAAEVRRQLLAAAAAMLEASVDDLEMGDSRLWVRGNPDRALPFAQVARFIYFARETTIEGRGAHGAEAYDVPLQIDGTAYGVLCTNGFSAQAAEVEVDPETGEVHLRRLVAALDCGKALNPQLVEGQIEGGVATGVGMVLWEEMQFEDGRPINAEFMDYLVPTTQDVPHIEAAIVEKAQHDGPFGAKGVGDGPPTASTAAIANAIFAATGVAIRELPITPERLLAALEAAQEASH